MKVYRAVDKYEELIIKEYKLLPIHIINEEVSIVNTFDYSNKIMRLHFYLEKENAFKFNRMLNGEVYEFDLPNYIIMNIIGAGRYGGKEGKDYRLECAPSLEQLQSITQNSIIERNIILDKIQNHILAKRLGLTDKESKEQGRTYRYIKLNLIDYKIIYEDYLEKPLPTEEELAKKIYEEKRLATKDEALKLIKKYNDYNNI